MLAMTLSRLVATRVRPSRPVDRLGLASQRLVGQAVEDLAHGGHPVAPQLKHHVEGRSYGAFSGHTRRIRHLVPRQAQRIPRGRVAEDGAPDPGVGGERQVPQRLDERPLTVDRLVQHRGVQPARPGNGVAP